MKLLKNQKCDKMKKNCWRCHHSTHVYQKPQSYEVHFLRYGVGQFFCHFGSFFTLYHPRPLTTQKAKILKKWNINLEMSSFETCATKNNQMIYVHSDMECDRHNFLSFKAIFCSFTTLLTPKIKIWKKCTKHLEILSFYKCAQ